MEPDREAPVFETGEIVVQAPPGAVWDTLADLPSWPAWFPNVRSVDVDGVPAVGTSFRWKIGQGTIRSVFVRFERPGSIGWTGRFLGISAVHLWHLTPVEDGTRVVSEESWNGLVARLLNARSRRTVRTATDEGLTALKAEAERRAGSPTRE
jgi:hypothetical protein